MSAAGEIVPARPAKGVAAFRTIGEVADDLDLPTHVDPRGLSGPVQDPGANQDD